MDRTERLEIRVSPKEKELFELRAKRRGMNVSDWLRACGHSDIFKEMDPDAVRQLVERNAQELLDMLAAGRAATYRADEQTARRTRVVAAIAKRRQSTR